MEPTITVFKQYMIHIIINVELPCAVTRKGIAYNRRRYVHMDETCFRLNTHFMISKGFDGFSVMHK